MARELSMAYVSQDEDTSQPERRTRFVGKRHSDIDESLSPTSDISASTKTPTRATLRSCPIIRRAIATTRSKTNLMRRETRRLSNYKIDEQAGEADIVCDDVVKLKIDY